MNPGHLYFLCRIVPRWSLESETPRLREISDPYGTIRFTYTADPIWSHLEQKSRGRSRHHLAGQDDQGDAQEDSQRTFGGGPEQGQTQDRIEDRHADTAKDR